jgi:hydrogenase maturation factor
MSVSPDLVETVLLDLKAAGLNSAAIIGEVSEFQKQYLNVIN